MCQSKKSVSGLAANFCRKERYDNLCGEGAGMVLIGGVSHSDAISRGESQ